MNFAPVPARELTTLTRVVDRPHYDYIYIDCNLGASGSVEPSTDPAKLNTPASHGTLQDSSGTSRETSTRPPVCLSAKQRPAVPGITINCKVPSSPRQITHRTHQGHCDTEGVSFDTNRVQLNCEVFQSLSWYQKSPRPVHFIVELIRFALLIEMYILGSIGLYGGCFVDSV